nr:immunoglobulin heavy chain junction region [Mus musculus]
CARGYGNRDYW